MNVYIMFIMCLSLSYRTKREYSSIGHDKKTPKKRTTLNSREASMSLEDVLAVRNALELYESGQRSPSPVEKKGNDTEVPHEELPPIKEQGNVETVYTETVHS